MRNPTSNSKSIVAFLIVILLIYGWQDVIPNKAFAQTGLFVQEMTNVDEVFSNFMARWNIPGGSIAIVKDGRLVYARGFGYADKESRELVEPDHLFRIASVTKPITSIAIMKLIDEGLINVDDKVFGTDGILNGPDYRTILDPRVKDITVRHLLQHTSGWGFINNNQDPMFSNEQIAQRTGMNPPVGPVAVIKFMLRTQRLVYEPGTNYFYSNFGYCILGRIIELVSGKTYENYVKTELLNPLGISQMRLGQNLYENRAPNEVKYYDFPGAPLVNSVYGTGQHVPFPYGGYNIEAMDAHGGWIASASDLARLLVAVDGFDTKPDILSQASVQLMTTASIANNNYSMGWGVNRSGNWWHIGDLPGNASILVRTNDELGWAVLFNTRPSNLQSFLGQMDNMVWETINKIDDWPTHDLFVQTIAEIKRQTVADPPADSKDLIPDTGLATAVREALNLAPNARITQQVMQKLKHLNARNRQITNLIGLEHATQVKELNLNSNQIRDLSPLTGLTQLERLLLTSSQISDVSPLAGLTQLKVLALGRNQIRDVSSLAKLTQLETLFLNANQIRDVNPLAELANLERLALAGNPITDTSPLASLTKLVDVDVEITAPISKGIIPDAGLAAAVRKALGLASNASITKQILRRLTTLDAKKREITDLTGLEHATQLEQLTLDNNQIQDVSPLSRLTQLQRLFLRNNQIQDVSPLSRLTQLRRLFLNGNQIQDISPIAGLTRLTNLNLVRNEIRDVSALAGLVNLRQLLLTGNPITDTSPLASLTKLDQVDVEITAPISRGVIPDAGLAAAVRASLGLAPNATITKEVVGRLKTLDAEKRQITNLTGLEHATQLVELDLNFNQIRNLSPLSGLTQLERLLLTSSQISDVNPLAGLTQLKVLAMGSNRIGDVSPLAGLRHLETLILWDNQISNIRPLAGLTQLTFLNIDENKISDIRPLAGLTQLTALLLRSNKISDVSPLAGLVNLKQLRLAGNPITDTSPLARLTKLTQVDVEITAPPTEPEMPVVTTPPAVTTETVMVPATDAVLSISPSQVTSPDVGEQLTLSLNIVGGEAVAGYQLTLQFDPTALRYVESSNGDYLPTGAFFVPPVVNSGSVELAATALVGDSNGDGTLTAVTFEVVTAKASTLTLSETLLADSQGNTFRPQVEAGEVAEPPKIRTDVTGDGIVNIQDLVLVASSFGQTGEVSADVNSDGVVNIADLVLVAGALGNAAAAPILHPQLSETLTAADVHQWLSQAQHLDLTDATTYRGIRYLAQLLSVLTPKETVLLPNYPNPFNPETWIPYQLEKPADVTVTIYGVNGEMVRRLVLGHQAAGIYQNRSRAAYWDGRNAFGESVASGVYFYTLTAGDFTATQKMLIRK